MPSLDSVPSDFLSNFALGFWATNRSLELVAIVGDDDFRDRILLSSGVVDTHEGYSFDLDDPQHPDVRPHLRARSGESVEWDTIWHGPIRARVCPQRGSSGEILGTLGVAVDMTTLRAAQERRMSVENLLHAILNEENFASVIHEQKNGVRYAEPRALRAREANVGQSANKKPQAASGESDKQQITCPANARSDMITVHLDYTGLAQKKSREEFTNGRQDHLQEVLDGFPKPVAIVTSSGLVKARNEHFYKLTGRTTRGEERISSVFNEITPQEFSLLYKKVRGSTPGASVERHITFRDQSRRIMRGSVIFSPSTGDQLMITVAECVELCDWIDSSLNAKRLSGTARRIMELLAEGKSNAEIAAEIHLSRQGLDYRLKKLREMLHAESRNALIGKAFAEGLFVRGAWPPRMVS
ncbi:hypothetical protein DV517_64830 [Streptomyces sp. S816]|nr:hypothetical protein DV517_64830 [Streptomyces sp. S816]